MSVVERVALSAPALPLLMALLCTALAGCDRPAQERGAPQVSGAVCATCGAVIGDERFAGQYRLSNGTVKSFDDPVCLFRALHQDMGEAMVVRFRSYNGDRWLAGDKTWFARTPSITSPHGAGWATFASFAEAQDAVTAAGSGEILSYEQATEKLGAPPAGS